MGRHCLLVIEPFLADTSQRQKQILVLILVPFVEASQNYYQRTRKEKKKRLQVENVPFTKTTAIRGQKALGKVTNPGEKKGTSGVNEGCRVG